MHPRENPYIFYEEYFEEAVGRRGDGHDIRRRRHRHDRLRKRETDIGPPHYEQFLPPIIKKNYGKWKYHEILKPGVHGATWPSRATSSSPCAPARRACS